MVKIIKNPPKEKPQRKKCFHCGAMLEYVKKDIQKGEREGCDQREGAYYTYTYKYITCPACHEKIELS